MKNRGHFLPILVMSLMVFFSQAASAGYMKYTYKSTVMDAYWESTVTQEGENYGTELFWGAQEQFEIEFVIPEIDFNDLLTSYATFDNPVTRVTSMNFFPDATINNSQFIIEASEYEGEIYVSWWLYLDISDYGFSNGMSRHASFQTTGGSSDYMNFNQEDYHYKRCAGQYPPEWEMGCHEALYDSHVEFSGDYEGNSNEYPGGIYRLYGEAISVPEPLAALLLLTGLAGIFFSRRVTFRNQFFNSSLTGFH